jgi:hypothetical protein
MIGPKQPLPSYRVARRRVIGGQATPLGFDAQLLRFQLHVQQASRLSQQLAIIRSNFAQRFAAASTDCCANARDAMLSRLQSEQSAELELSRERIGQEGEALRRDIALPPQRRFKVPAQFKTGAMAKPMQGVARRRTYRRRRWRVVLRPLPWFYSQGPCLGRS